MTAQEIQARTMVRSYRRVDPWFIAGAGFNLYRGCAHDCSYCDGRSEKYQVSGDFGKDVAVKTNALELLRRELGPRGGEQPELPFPGASRGQACRGFIMLGGGVGDSYQPVEEQVLAARRALELLADLGRPVHVLTKSTLVLRDADVIQQIRKTAGALVSFSISTSSDDLGHELEPGASLPSERLAALSELRRRGIPGGVFLLPVIPFLSDSPQMMDQSVRAAMDAGAQYVLFGGMTLKPGRQKDHFLERVGRGRPGLRERIASLYPEGGPRAKWGQASAAYYARIGETFNECALRLRVPPRIPRRLFPAGFSGHDLASVLLEHIGTLLSVEGLHDSPGDAEVREIQSTGTCSLYEKLMARFT